MKNVVIIAGSPRVGGNTETLVKEFARGAKEAGNKVSVVSLAKDKVAPCTGCYVCQNTHKCWQKDKADAILKKMQKADVIVFASPVYFYSISAQLKALFDRSVVIYPNLEKKQYYFLMAMADTNRKMFDGTIKAMQGFLDCYEGSKLKGMVCASGVYEKGEILKTKFPSAAYKLGLKVR